VITSPIGAAVVGYGYWGPNIVRNILERPELRLLGLCERDPARAAEFGRRHPDVRVETELEELLLDPRIEAVMIATPPRTHHALARIALRAGRHVLVEKPLASSVAEAGDLIELAAQMDRVLMPAGELGEVYFVTSSRMNLGIYQADGVISDLAPHDLSILLYWLDRPLTHLAASGQSVFQEGVPETAFLNLTFEQGARANVQISWLAPRKLRHMVVVGSKRMVSYEDTSADESVRIYDRGLDVDQAQAPATFGEYRLTYRSGDIVVPRIDAAEPLGLELADFANAVRTGEEPRSSARLGLEVVRALDAAHASMRRDGDPIELTAPERGRTSAARVLMS
jgi:predicted dehydrogenase